MRRYPWWYALPLAAAGAILVVGSLQIRGLSWLATSTVYAAFAVAAFVIIPYLLLTLQAR